MKFENPTQYNEMIKEARGVISSTKMYKNIVDPATDEFIIESIVQYREKKFDQYGIAAVDIETCLDTTGEFTMYNMRPFLCHIYGELQRLTSGDNGVMYKVLEKVDMSFQGYDCMS